MKRFQRWRPYLLPAAALMVFAGVVGPWIDHAAAGLVITGLDLGEYVKFLPGFLDGTLTLWRPGLYAPLLAASLALSAYAFDTRYGYGWPARTVLLVAAAVLALNMLPPAWTPRRMLTPEFRPQALAIALGLAAAAISPMVALIDRRVRGGVVALLALAGLWFPLRGFAAMRGEIDLIYGASQPLAWGPYVMAAGLLGLLVLGLSELWEKSNASGNSD